MDVFGDHYSIFPERINDSPEAGLGTDLILNIFLFPHAVFSTEGRQQGGKSMGFGLRSGFCDLGARSSSVFMSCEYLGKLFQLSGPQFPHLLNGNNSNNFM